MKLDLISAWNDSGGGYLARLLDGAPDTHVWPYELLLGNDEIQDGFGDWFKNCYRWPGFGDQKITFKQAMAFFDKTKDPEIKSVLVNGEASKHADFSIKLDLTSWRESFLSDMASKTSILRSDLLPAYVNAVRLAVWGNIKEDKRVIGHCPVIILDAVRIWQERPCLKFVHVVRNPVNCFTDFSKRHSKADPSLYALKWKSVNDYALILAKLFPQNVKIVPLQALLCDKANTLHSICEWLQISFDEAVLEPTWLSRPLNISDMGPFGGVSELSSDREFAIFNSNFQGREVLLRLCAGSLEAFRDFRIELTP